MTQPSQIEDELVECFRTNDVQRARNLTANDERSTTAKRYRAHPAFRRFVDENNGHCYKRPHLQIADLLTPPTVRRFRDAVVGDQIKSVRQQLADDSKLANAEFTAGRGVARAIHHWKSVPVAQALIDADAELNTLTTRGESPVAMQARFGTVVGLHFLLERGADPNLGAAPHIPSDRLVEVIELLLDHDWDIRSHNQLLHDAKHGHGQRIETWLRYGVAPTISNATGQTAMHLLAAKGSGRAAIRALANAGADINAVDCEGRTPLDFARLAPSESALNELLSLGAE